MIRGKIRLSWQYVATLFIANLFLLLPNANALRVASGFLLIGILPGLSWANRLLPQTSLPLRVTIAAGISYAITNLVTLLLHYLPGPVSTWQLLVTLNILALLPLSIRQGISPLPNPLPKGEGTQASLPPGGIEEGLILNEAKMQGSKEDGNHAPARMLLRSPALLQFILPSLLILSISIFLRTANLNYSEFQGDEALAMISAAEALEGHEDALFLRSKGPGEVLLPMALWRLTGTITEAIARLPFTVASLFAIVTIYLIGQQLAGDRVGWLAAGFFAFNGFMVAFGRIVQYQALVVWMSALAFLMLLHWQSTQQYRFALLGGLFLGTGLLAHYDAILVSPALLWLLLFSGQRSVVSSQKVASSGPRSAVGGQFNAILLFAGATLLAALPFYLPYALDPQANRTGAYVGERIGNELRNNLPDFFHFNTFYSSSYYLIISGLLLLIVCLWILWQAGSLGRFVSLLATLGIVAVVISPNVFEQLAFLPFAILLFSVFLTLFFKKFSLLHPSALAPLQAVIIWLAVPFLGYNFVVALGLTHIYTTVPAWALLAALGWNQLTIPKGHFVNNYQLSISNLQSPISNLFFAIFLLLLTIFLWNAFVRHDVEYWQDYPDGNLSMFWTPYAEPPQAGFFGFAHRAGWKAIGQKIAAGELSGDYGSNEEPDVTTWYTRGAPRACDPQPEYYFLADDLIDPIEVPQDIIEAHYQEVGQVILSNQKQMQIMQQIPIENEFDEVDEAVLASAFDSSATPAVFARSARGAISRTANFGNQIQLIGYDLDTRRAYPGGRIPVTLYWQAITPLSTGYQVFTHLESETGPAAQSDGVPVCWTYPTDVWRPGQIIADQHAIALPPDITTGQYPLEIGLYVPDTFERLDILDEVDNPAGTSLTLDVVEIRKAGG